MDNRQTEHTTIKCFRCGSEDHLIVKCPNPPKDNEKRKNQVRFSERVNRALQKECENGKNKNDQKIYASMARMYDNDECSSRDFGDILQLTNWILESGATCQTMPHVSDFILGLLEDWDKHIEVADRHQITAKQKGQVQIKFATITEIILSQHCTAHTWHQIYATGYFPLFR